MITVGQLAAKYDDEYPDADPLWTAMTAVRNTPAATRRTLLAALVEERIRERRRERARLTEQAAGVARWRDQERELAPLWAAHLRDFYCDSQHQTRDAIRQCERKLERTGELDKRRLRVTDPAEYDRRYPSPWVRLGRAVEEYRSSVRLELTVELLGTSFAIGDGRKVTWGSASVSDHERRIDMLSRQAMGTLQTMTLHEKAIELLREHEARCLNDVRLATVAA